ncbi:hypothetical protein DMB37_13215 [Nocardia sp. CS682]|nr:hypothetical protein DMB37_13215 [Nocardia sp. CS682]
MCGGNRSVTSLPREIGGLRGDLDQRAEPKQPVARTRATRTAGVGRPIFAASMTGRCSSATVRTTLHATVAVPLAPLVVSALLRRPGVPLRARGLPLVPGPPQHFEESSR